VGPWRASRGGRGRRRGASRYFGTSPRPIGLDCSAGRAAPLEPGADRNRRPHHVSPPRFPVLRKERGRARFGGRGFVFAFQPGYQDHESSIRPPPRPPSLPAAEAASYRTRFKDGGFQRPCPLTNQRTAHEGSRTATVTGRESPHLSVFRVSRTQAPLLPDGTQRLPVMGRATRTAGPARVTKSLPPRKSRFLLPNAPKPRTTYNLLRRGP